MSWVVDICYMSFILVDILREFTFFINLSNKIKTIWNNKGDVSEITKYKRACFYSAAES